MLAKYARACSNSAGVRRWRLLQSHDLRALASAKGLERYHILERAGEGTVPVMLDTHTDSYETRFSISHKWPFVAASCAGAGELCGIDIERIGAISGAAARRYVPEVEWLTLRGADDAEKRTLLWTIKEAVFKALRPQPAGLAIEDIHISSLECGDAVFNLTLEIANRTLSASAVAATYRGIVCTDVRIVGI